MNRRKIVSIRNLLLATALCLPTAALAEIPVFSAQCLSNSVDADSTGTVRINGAPMDVEQINPNYYEARMEGLTISISHEGGGRDLIVNFTGSGGVNGVCQVLSVASSEGAGADDGGGAMAGASDAERVSFAAGTSGTEFTDRLSAGESRRYVLGASNGQDLYFRIDAEGPGLSYRIVNPDGSALLDEVRADTEYRGQLWQSGDHVIEVINASNRPQTYAAIFGIN